MVVDETGPGSCPTACFVISGVEHLGVTTTELVES
jgi:hypothetical protein